MKTISDIQTSNVQIVVEWVSGDDHVVTTYDNSGDDSIVLRREECDSLSAAFCEVAYVSALQMVGKTIMPEFSYRPKL